VTPKTGSETTTDNSASIDIYDACSDLVADVPPTAPTSSDRLHDQCRPRGEPVTLPTSGCALVSGPPPIPIPRRSTTGRTERLGIGDFRGNGEPRGLPGRLRDPSPTPTRRSLRVRRPRWSKIASLAPGTGDVVETYHDISVPGAGVPLSLTRTYDSGVAQEQVTTTTTPGPLGYGWSYNLGMSLSLNTSTEVATVDQENGTLLRFSPYVSGSSPAWCAGTTNLLPPTNHRTWPPWNRTRGALGPWCATSAAPRRLLVSRPPGPGRRGGPRWGVADGHR